MKTNKIKIIIGPSKTFNAVSPSDNPRPTHILKAKYLFNTFIRPLTLEQTKMKYKLSNQLAEDVYLMHQKHGESIYNAIEVFGGQVFKQLKLDEYDKDWLQEHLLIIDPLYGPLKPYDTISLYRLDMQTPIAIDLKEYWKNDVEKALDGYKIINLAAKEWTEWLNLTFEEVELPAAGNIKTSRGQKLHQLILEHQNKK